MQEDIWEREYKKPKLVTMHDEPQQAVKNFFRFLRRSEKMPESGLFVLDLGSGTGRNSNYLAELGHVVTGIEISRTALNVATERAIQSGVKVAYIKGSIGEKFPSAESSFDVALDVTTSNSLTEAERDVYIKETSRTLKPGGFLFVRALCKDGDSNAKELIKNFPGKEKDTYIMPEFGLTERVFSKEDFLAAYSPLFEVADLEKISHYSKFNGRLFKRNYWIAYLRNKKTAH